jgi:uncharacterized membrane protein YjjB (DUF3815 family)
VRSGPENLILRMRNPGKRRNLSLVVALAGMGYMVVALQVLNLDPRGKGTFASMVAAVMATLAGVGIPRWRIALAFGIVIVALIVVIVLLVLAKTGSL